MACTCICLSWLLALIFCPLPTLRCEALCCVSQGAIAAPADDSHGPFTTLALVSSNPRAYDQAAPRAAVTACVCIGGSGDGTSAVVHIVPDDAEPHWTETRSQAGSMAGAVKWIVNTVTVWSGAQCVVRASICHCCLTGMHSNCNIGAKQKEVPSAVPAMRARNSAKTFHQLRVRCH